MSFDREWELAKWQQWVDGDTEALGELYKRFSGLIVSIIREFDYDKRWSVELAGEASVGFMVAMKRFDPLRGNMLSYIALCVRAQIRQSIPGNYSCGMVRRTGEADILKAAREMKNGKDVDERLAARVRKRRVDLVQILDGEDSEDVGHSKLWLADDAPTPEERFEQLQTSVVLSRALHECIYGLSDIQRAAIADLLADVSTTQVAKERGVTKEAVRQNRLLAQKNLRKLMMQRPDVAELVGTILDRGSLRT